MTTDEYVPSDEEVQELIVGLLLDAGDYVRHGQPDPGETLTWNQREVRAWRAARLLSERHAHDARVRRDAALTLAEHFSAEAIDQARQGNPDGADFYRAVATEIENQIPEETP